MKMDFRSFDCRETVRQQTNGKLARRRETRRRAPAFLVRLLGKTQAERLCDDRDAVPHRD